MQCGTHLKSISAVINGCIDCMIIYKITNKITGKVYIGQTVRTLQKRWKQHVNAKDSLVIHNSIRKYGVENFTVEQIDIACSRDELNKKEIYWISFYNSLYPNGYNLTSGGNQYTLSEKSKEKCGDSFRGKFGKEHNRSKPVKCIETGKIFGSINEVEREMNIDHRLISRCLVGKRKTTGGYHWCYIE